MVYAGFTIACIVSLKLAGMNWFDAICHAFAAMSLGGFSTHDNSVGFFNSLPIEIILTLFQLLAAINFATHYIVIHRKSLKRLHGRYGNVGLLGLGAGQLRVDSVSIVAQRHFTPTSIRHCAMPRSIW